jgi:hypothetical protein
MKFTITIESEDGNKSVCTLDNLFQATDACLVLFGTDFYYNKKAKQENKLLELRTLQYSIDYGVSVFQINKEAEDRLNKKMFE